jgi:DNA-binding transcriptional ArsR family regulator
MISVNTEIYRTLGLNKKDILIYEVLKKHAGLKVSEIVAKTKLPRMTIHITLLSFLKRGLISKEKLGKQKYYSIDDNNIIERESLKINEVDELKIYRGESGIRKIFEIFGSMKNINYEGYSSAKNASKLLEYMGLNNIVKLNNSIRNNKQIGRNFIESNYIDYLKKHFSPTDFKKWTNSLQRTAVVHEINKEDFYSETDVYTIGGSVYIISYIKKLVIEIRQPETANLLRNFINLLRHFDHPRSFNDWVNQKKAA